MQCNTIQQKAITPAIATADKTNKFAALKTSFRSICSFFSFPQEIQWSYRNLNKV